MRPKDLLAAGRRSHWLMRIDEVPPLPGFWYASLHDIAARNHDRVRHAPEWSRRPGDSPGGSPWLAPPGLMGDPPPRFNPPRARLGLRRGFVQPGSIRNPPAPLRVTARLGEGGLRIEPLSLGSRNHLLALPSG